jgi:hypothetical protein
MGSIPGDNRSLDELRTRISTTYGELLFNVRSSLEAHVVSRLGLSIEVLGQDLSRLRALLNHPEAEIRACAVDYVTCFHPCAGAFSDDLKKLAIEDSSLRVREHATAGLVALYIQERDEEIKAILYAICIDATEDEDIRKSAYLSLIQIDEGTTRRGRGEKGIASGIKTHCQILDGKSLDELLDLDRLARIVAQ